MAVPEVHGIELDAETRCVHYRSTVDVAGDPGRAIVAALERALVHDLLVQSRLARCFDRGTRGDRRRADWARGGMV